MAFQKGHTPWLKGTHIQTNNALKKWRKGGGQPWNKGKHTGVKYWLGKKRSEETKRKISLANQGRKLSQDWKKKIIKNLWHNRYKKCPKEIREKISIANAISNKGKKADKCSAWKGGKYKTYQGYIMIYSPMHPFKNYGGYVQQHRLIMEKYIGRYLKSEERVHHINGIKNDNRIENLKLFDNISHHRMAHRKQWNCNIKNCKNIHYGKGLCQKHYQLQRYKINHSN